MSRKQRPLRHEEPSVKPPIPAERPASAQEDETDERIHSLIRELREDRSLEDWEEEAQERTRQREERTGE